MYVPHRLTNEVVTCCVASTHGCGDFSTSEASLRSLQGVKNSGTPAFWGLGRCVVSKIC